MSNEDVLFPLYKQLYEKIKAKDLLVDKSGAKIAEIIAPRVELDPTQKIFNFPGIETNESYIEKEYRWYMSKDLSVDSVKDVKIWSQVADSNGEINSNYGYLVYSKGNFSQFSNVIKTLENHRDSRQAIIIYTRPSIHYEWNSNGGSDFICTLYQQFFIRDNKLHCITNMRSSDSIFGLRNDLPWFNDVILTMHKNLKITYPDLEIGTHIFIANSFHIYERHFSKLEKMIHAWEAKNK